MSFINVLYTLWPHGDSVVPGLRDGVAKSAQSVFKKYNINTSLVVAHIMAQFSEESGGGTEMVENMNYSAARLLKVFPTHFTSSQAIALQHQPRLIADRAYGGRMGNAPPPSDDGWNFRGQGFSQLTGRSNYVALAKATGLDLVNHPEFLRDPDHAFDCAVGDFIMCGCLPYALKDSLVGVSSMLNVGHYVSNPAKINGYSMRAAQLTIWKHALGDLSKMPDFTIPPAKGAS
jgi:putative chitinase